MQCVAGVFEQLCSIVWQSHLSFIHCESHQIVTGGDGAAPLGMDELMPIYTDECVRFIRNHANDAMAAEAAKPFLLVFTPDNTHVPVYASARFRLC